MFDEKFLEEHPLTTSYLKDVFKQRIVQAFEETNVPGEMHEMLIAAALDNVRMLDILTNNPCVLFEMFDDKEIYFYVYPYHKNKITYYTHSFVGMGFSEAVGHEHPTRKEAEHCVLREAFDVLEKELTIKKELSS